MSFFRILICISIVSFFSLSTVAQQIKGLILDKADNSEQIGVGVFLIDAGDTTNKKGTATDLDGRFGFSQIQPGKYILRTAYLGYQTLEMPVTIADSSNADIGALYIEQIAIETKTVTVQGKQLRTIQKGDTTEHNAGAYKTNPDATAEDLVTKMPGITLENGTVKAQGEAVQKVLIDGKEFFGDDAAMALKNLPAEIVDKVQVFDRMSDQSQFTGFDDGNSQKTINIVTKEGRNNGSFGKVFAGYGTNNRYTSGVNLNSFKGQRKISLIGLSNNINQQNFSSQDLVGLSSGSGGAGGGRGQGGGNSGGGAGGRGGQGGNNNFLVGQQGGITTTNSIGLNYSDAWSKKLLVTGSYFFNNTYNQNQSVKQRTYFLTRGVNQFYNENSNTGTDNYNHRFTARVEYNMDSSNSFIFTPRVSFQNNNSGTSLLGNTALADSVLLSQINNSNKSTNNGFDYSANLLYRHKFQKKGRTVSFGLTGNNNNRDGNTRLYSNNHFLSPVDSVNIQDQETNSTSGGYTLSPSLIYTEPVSKTGIVSVNYSPSYAQNNSSRITNSLDTTTGTYSNLNPVLSNRFNNTIITQRAGFGYRVGNKKLRLTSNLNYQNVDLRGNQEFPVNFVVEKTFDNLLPSLMLNYKFSNTKNIRIYYRTSTQVPSVTQLQNVINNTNPLLLSTGNPDLKQEYTHSFMTRYGYSNGVKATSFNAFVNLSLTNNYIGSSTLVATQNTVLNENVVLNRGSQLSRPVNLDGYYNLTTFLTYGFPLSFIKSNLNLNAGYLYSRTPGLINQNLNYANTSTFNGGFTLGSNISPNIDFTLAYSGNYNIVKNTNRPTLDNNYFYHLASFRFNWIAWKGLFVGSELNNSLYQGLGSFNRNFYLWNPYAGYKFLKNKAAEVRVTVFDILNQNNSISRTITGSYLEDNQTLVLRRYLMVTLTYNIRRFTIKPELEK